MIDADSVMLARAAERNPSVFLPAGPRCNVTEIVPKLLQISEYTKNPWGNTKFLLNQFKPSPPPISKMPKAEKKEYQEMINKSKSVEEVAEKLNVGLDLGKCRKIMGEVEARIKERQADQEEQDVFEERKEKEDAGQVVDEPSEGVEEKAQVDGFDVGVGQAETGEMPVERSTGITA
jgi:tRNA-dihydrouridine synthase 2